MMPTQGSSQNLGKANETFIHNQVFRALDKILSKANQVKQSAPNLSESATNFQAPQGNSATFGQVQ